MNEVNIVEDVGDQEAAKIGGNVEADQPDRSELSHIALEYAINEFNRQTAGDKALVDRSDKIIERYITVATAIIGVIFALSSLLQPEGIDWYVACGIILVPLIIGATSYSYLVTIDFYFRRHDVRRKQLSAKFVKELPEIEPYLMEPTAMLYEKDFSAWSSTKSILQRAVVFGGAKTLIAIGNSISVAIMSFLFFVYGVGLAIWPTGAGLSFAVFLLAGVIHIGYARLRYKLNNRFFVAL